VHGSETMTAKLQYGVQSDRGCVRQNNEDAYGVAPELGLFVLSDGMGGLEYGEVASRLAVDTILDHCREAAQNPQVPLEGPRIDGVSEDASRLLSAVRIANRAIHAAALDGGVEQMGATVVAVRLVENRLSIAHVGDSRAYLLHAGQLNQVTQDHSYVAEQVRHGRMSADQAGASALQNVLMRALGVDQDVEADVTEELVTDADTILLCSDGLTRELSDAQIAAALGEHRDPQHAADALVDLAIRAGGGDNVTVIVLRVSAKPHGLLGRMGNWFKKTC
jgi:serine/threonine protein phosphatase PrpC